jgi:peptide/nickel transport system permease protein
LSAALRHLRYVLGENPVTLASFALFVVLVAVAVLGPWIEPYDPLATDAMHALTPPSAGHWCGTDAVGRDILSRIIAATRLDLGIAFAAVVLSFAIGALAGLAAGYFGGWTERAVGRAADTIMAFPLFVLAMGIVAALGNTTANIVYATAIINMPLYARVARTEASVLRQAGFIEAARLGGNGEMRILLAQVLLNAAGLSFIGLGISPPTPEWGIMVAEGASNIISGEWWVALFPGLALMLAVFCFNLLGDGLRDLIDPRRRT